MAEQFVTVTGTITNGTNATVTFTPSGWLADPANDLNIPPAPDPVYCDPAVNQYDQAAGTFSLELLATDSTGPLPANWYWTCKITGIPDTPPLVFSFYLLHAAGATQDLSTLTPIEDSDTYAAYLPLSGGQMTGALGPAVINLVDQPVIAIPAAQANHFRLPLGGNRTVALPTGGYDGQLVLIDFIQPESGGPFTVSFAAGYDFGNPAVVVALSATPGAEDTVGLQCNAPASTWKVLAFGPGYRS